MKTTIKTGLAAFVLLLAISCKKENNSIPSSPVNDKSSTEALLTDIDGVAAGAITIGTQKWKTTNLNVGRYRNGDLIPQVTDPNAWAALTTGAWCFYNNDPATYKIYGKLYNWYAVHDPRGLAPLGWHIPSDAEFTTLSTFLGGEAVAGGKMKEIGTTHWLAPNTDANNSSGFTGLPGGQRRKADGGYSYIYTGAYFWTSTEYPEADPDEAWMRNLESPVSLLWRSHYWQGYGLSVRCIKD